MGKRVRLFCRVKSAPPSLLGLSSWYREGDGLTMETSLRSVKLLYRRVISTVFNVKFLYKRVTSTVFRVFPVYFFSPQKETAQKNPRATETNSGVASAALQSRGENPLPRSRPPRAELTSSQPRGLRAQASGWRALAGSFPRFLAVCEAPRQASFPSVTVYVLKAARTFPGGSGRADALPGGACAGRLASPGPGRGP